MKFLRNMHENICLLQISQQECKYVGHIFLTNMDEHTGKYFLQTRTYPRTNTNLHTCIIYTYVYLLTTYFLQSQTNILKHVRKHSRQKIFKTYIYFSCLLLSFSSLNFLLTIAIYFPCTHICTPRFVHQYESTHIIHVHPIHVHVY